MAVDLDKARAARREAAGEGPVVIFGGVSHQLDAEMPYGVLEAFQMIASDDDAAKPAALVEAAKALLGPYYDEWRGQEQAPSIDDLKDLIEGVMEEYGVEAPLASSAS